MVENTHYRSDQSDLDYGQDITGRERPRRYAFGRTANVDHGDSVPLFLSDPDGEPDPEEYNPLQPQRRLSLSFKLLMTASAAACVAVLFAWFTSDATRDVLMSAKASIATVLPIPSTAAQAEASELTAGDMQVKDPAPAKDVARWPSPATQPSATPPSGPPRQQLASAAPSREEITSAYQNALQSHAPAAAPAAVPPSATAPVALAPVAAPPQAAPLARKMDADELATLMKRAKESLAAGDIPVARLLLERAADGQEPLAAMMLAQTYDPDVLGTSDVRNITPEPEKAQAWYQRAAQLGSADAQRRLAQMHN